MCDEIREDPWRIMEVKMETHETVSVLNFPTETGPDMVWHHTTLSDYLRLCVIEHDTP